MTDPDPLQELVELAGSNLLDALESQQHDPYPEEEGGPSAASPQKLTAAVNAYCKLRALVEEAPPSIPGPEETRKTLAEKGMALMTAADLAAHGLEVGPGGLVVESEAAGTVEPDGDNDKQAGRE